MISEKYHCIYVHIPKTAGQSIERFFLKLHGLSWKERAPLLLRPNSDPKRGPQRLAHLTAQEYVNCGYVSDKEFKSYFSFSFVRNPWARLVSEYRYRGYDREHTFHDFVTAGLPKKNKYGDAYRHVMPQYDYLHDENGELLVDFVGKFENLQGDFRIVCSKLGIPESELPHINPSKNVTGMKARLRDFLSKSKVSRDSHYTDYFDEELSDIVAEIYAADIRAFDYEFAAPE